MIPGFNAFRREGFMAVISVASDKGGPGKTTLSILVAAELALDGYSVRIIDTDANQQAAAFGAKSSIAGLAHLMHGGMSGAILFR
jgi:Mrp family chromosome partitioning ATPase